MVKAIFKLVFVSNVLPQNKHLKLRIYVFEQKAQQALFPNPSQGNVAENIAEIAERPDLRRLSRVDAIFPKLYIFVKPRNLVVELTRSVNAVRGVRKYPLSEQEIEIPTPDSQFVPQGFPMRPKAGARAIKISLSHFFQKLFEKTLWEKNVCVNEKEFVSARCFRSFVPSLSRMPSGNDCAVVPKRDLHRVVLRTRIRNDDLVISELLLFDGFQKQGQIFFFVQGRDNNAEFGPIHPYQYIIRSFLILQTKIPAASNSATEIQKAPSPTARAANGNQENASATKEK